MYALFYSSTAVIKFNNSASACYRLSDSKIKAALKPEFV